MNTTILILVLTWPGMATHKTEAYFPNMQECLAALVVAEIVIPSNNADNEWAGYKVCAPVSLED